ncbi:hypothetical protein PNIG_a1803 [Pseudoalteromonas nigrifaciens]|uniref:Uncharacterized protein n=1 Tax=Pseudoalteromonas nigrifaciens TaxID=28109 RepID=A0AAC9UHW2_9GAMM|nr:hypothetical protein [Pseudoalteromonas nigrifaciens]ASM53901.1 hypothetical protein PNIG_a1803 [Pseudoalteromonas nigrifaciens]GEN43604.1 hypothetical protein PNI02_30700 [Pseudoalteromonas nigrifaciens]SUC52259.1 Uncharacterised protein [Pseudoalteromonas nigrifaciens]
MELCGIIVKGLVAFLVAVGAARVGIYYFFKQKEYELVKSRYLDGSVDLLLVELENGLNITSHNFTRALNIIKAYRDQEDTFDLTELKKGFIDIDKPQFHLVANHRLQILSGSGIFWSTYQLALSYILHANIMLTNEIIDVIRMKETTDKISENRDNLIEPMMQAVKAQHDEGFKYSKMIHQFQVISDLLERNEMTFKQIEGFRKKKEVIQVIEMLEKDFSKELAELKTA